MQVHDGPPGVATRRPSSFLLIPVGSRRQGFAFPLRFNFLIEHDLVGKPLHTPHQVRGRLFPDHAQ
jgi:hypothetical protein